VEQVVAEGEQQGALRFLAQAGETSGSPVTGLELTLDIGEKLRVFRCF
jgi:hypothetical protein